MTAAAAAGRVRARASLSRRDGRLTWASAPPLVLRRTGAACVHLVQVGGGPLGGDDLGLGIDLGPGETLTVRTAAATLVQPGRTGGPATFTVRARLDAGAALHWRPEPTVLADRADWDTHLELDLAAGAAATVVDQLVLGRSGQRGGRCRSALRADVAGRPLLATATHLDGADDALGGPGGTGGARSVGTVLLAGDEVADRPGPEAGEEPDVAWAWTVLDGPGALLTAVGTVRGVARVLGVAAG